MISIIDYGVANIGALLNMLQRIGVKAHIVSSKSEIVDSEKLILPGVGSFDNGAKHLHESGLFDPILSAVLQDNTPILGICLGMQLLGTGSEEGSDGGLGLLDAKSKRFPNGLGYKVPHMGWNEIQVKRENKLLNSTDEKSRFYFTHSYYLDCVNPQNVVGTAVNGVEFAAMVNQDHIYGVQFHPEKSHRFGKTLLENFAAI